MEARQRKRLAIGTLVSLGLAGLLLWAAAPEMSYYATPSEVGAGGTPVGAILRVGGTVKPGSLQPASAGRPAALVLTDGAKELHVEFSEPLPALLREGQEAVAEGRLANGILQASRIFPRFDDPLKQTR